MTFRCSIGGETNWKLHHGYKNIFTTKLAQKCCPRTFRPALEKLPQQRIYNKKNENEKSEPVNKVVTKKAKKKKESSSSTTPTSHNAHCHEWNWIDNIFSLAAFYIIFSAVLFFFLALPRPICNLNNMVGRFTSCRLLNIQILAINRQQQNGKRQAPPICKNVVLILAP